MSPSGSAPVILIVGRLARDAKGVRGAPFAAGQRYFQAVARGGGMAMERMDRHTMDLLSTE